MTGTTVVRNTYFFDDWLLNGRIQPHSDGIVKGGGAVVFLFFYGEEIIITTQMKK